VMANADEATITPINVRPSCPRCLRPQHTCICSALPADAPLVTATRIVVLVHPKESQRALGTAPLLRLCLQHLIVKVADRFPEPDADPPLHEAVHANGHRCMLVCPGPDAEVLRPEKEPVAGAAGLRTLIFIDGRWPQAKTMVNRSPWLQALPRVVLCPTEQSGYFFRKQPSEGCLSTLEAVAEALFALEGDQGATLKAALLAPFYRMVEYQCSYMPGMQDKNRDLGVRATRLFDGEAVLERFKAEGATGHSDPRCGSDVHCILRWGSTSVSSREIVVVQVMRCNHTTARRQAMSLSKGRSRGQRCWILPVHKVPAGARIEVDEEVQNESLAATACPEGTAQLETAVSAAISE